MPALSENIVAELEARHAVPKPTWHFRAVRSAFWLLAISSTLIGGVAFAVASFVFLDNDGLSVAVLEKSSIYDIAQTIPFFWLILLGLFTASAYHGFRHTRKGYRFATIRVVLVVMATSVVLGMLLNTVDFGQHVHRYLLLHTGYYDALIHSREDLEP
jgi:tryptophan-rich sensory protein